MTFLGKERFEYETYAEVYIVLEEDGTEVSFYSKQKSRFLIFVQNFPKKSSNFAKTVNRKFRENDRNFRFRTQFFQWLIKILRKGLNENLETLV